MNGSHSAAGVERHPGDVMVPKSRAGVQPSPELERKTTATIRTSKPSTIRPPKRSADRKIIEEEQQFNSESESTPVTPRKLTPFNMFEEKLSTTRPKFHQMIFLENPNLKTLAISKKAETPTKPKSEVEETKGWF